MNRIAFRPHASSLLLRSFRIRSRILLSFVLALAAADLVAIEFARGAESRRSSRRSRATTTAAPETTPESEPVAKEETGKPAMTLADALKFAEESRAAVKEVKDYTAVFTKTELVKGRMIRQEMDMKFRARPFSVYLKYRSEAEAGRQAIYVEGRNDNRLAVKEVGLKGVVPLQLKLDSALVMDENRYPVTHVGIANLLKTATSTWERESKMQGIQPEVKFFPNAKLGDVPCQVVQVTQPKPHKDLKYYIGRVYFDKETKLPIRAECYGWPRNPREKKPPLVEDYIYSNLKLNVGLTDADFTPARYGF